MKLELRLERPEDYYAVEEVTQDAFWGQSGETCDEHYLAHILRKSPDFVPELDYVAEVDGKIAGNIMYTKAAVKSAAGDCYPVLNFGPLSVAPAYQNLGVGKALVTHSLAKAKELDYPAVIIFGEPDYYPKLGFKLAETFDITTADNRNFDAFMCYPLRDIGDALAGKFYESPVFKFDQVAAKAFDKRFPYKKPKPIIPVADLLLSAEAKAKLLEKGVKRLMDFHVHSVRELKQWVDNEADQKMLNACLKEQGYPTRFKF